MNPYKKLKTIWDETSPHIEAADSAFVFLRVIIFCGGIGWLLFSEISRETFENVSSIFIYFAIYSIFIYLWLFIAPQRKKIAYVAALVFDLLFTSLLVRVTGGFESSFFNGFYLITALYSFYFGLVPGVAIAAVAGSLYFVSCNDEFPSLHWTDFFVRMAFLFLLAVPIGILSQKLKKDKQKIENLNKDLEGYIEELRNVQGQLIQVEKLSAIGRLTADVAHEIRNPLTSIGGFARRLNKKLLGGSKEKKYAEIVVAEVDRLERILRDVLTFSKEAKYDIQYQEIDGTITESIGAFADICSDQGIKIVETLDSALPGILIDKEQVRLAVNNLISNAIDVMPKGGTLTIQTYLKDMYDVSFVAIEVSDTGPGMPDETLCRLFEPFFTTKEIGVGTGLGLSICKKIMDDHNGLIFVESQQGKGTTFRMLFPYQSNENGSRIKCWEFNKCGVENAEGAANMRCPAYPYYGRICWAIAGTFCGKKVSGAIAQKLGNCRKCMFYKRVAVSKDI
ncbi:MAG: sensor histidine kinase [Nitrospiraceae bacterium]|nr:MAG: sensor histidine kinase [Nitrospiraceae bacterium]